MKNFVEANFILKVSIMIQFIQNSNSVMFTHFKLTAFNFSVVKSGRDIKLYNFR